MAADILAGVGIFKNLYDSAKALKDINDATVRNAAVIELQEKILTAQQSQLSLIERINNLEEKVRSTETWETEKQQYDLKHLGWTAYAYMLKPEMRGSKPPHWVCTNCYGKGHISIIQYGFVEKMGLRYFCPSCKTQINPSSDALDHGQIKWLDEPPGEPHEKAKTEAPKAD